MTIVHGIAHRFPCVLVRRFPEFEIESRVIGRDAGGVDGLAWRVEEPIEDPLCAGALPTDTVGGVREHGELSILEALDCSLGQFDRAAGVDLAIQDECRDRADDGLVVDRVGLADCEAGAGGEDPLHCPRRGLDNGIAAAHSLDRLGRLERELLLAEVGEEQPLDVATLTVEEGVELGIVVTQPAGDAGRQASRAFTAVERLQQEGCDLVGRVPMETNGTFPISIFSEVEKNSILIGYLRMDSVIFPLSTIR